MSAVRSDVQRSEIVHGDVVDWSAMIQQDSGTVDVIALCGHMQWDKSILGLRTDWSRRLVVQQEVHHLVVSASRSTV